MYTKEIKAIENNYKIGENIITTLFLLVGPSNIIYIYL